MKQKTLGEVAKMAALLTPLALGVDAAWSAAADAVVTEHERRKAASEVPTTAEIGLWLSAKRVAAINTYCQRTGKPLHEGYAAIAEAVKKP